MISCKRNSVDAAEAENDHQHLILKRPKIKEAGYMNDRQELLHQELPTKIAIEHTKSIGEEWQKMIENKKAADRDKQRIIEQSELTAVNTFDERIKSLEANQKIILENQQTILHNIVKLQENNLNGLSQIAAVLEKLLNKNSMVKVDAVFPIKSWEELKDIDELCRNDSTRYIQCIKAIVSPEGIEKNFHRLVDRKLIQLLNYDGVSNKAPFKDFTFLNSAIFEAIKSEGYTNKEYVRDIRNSFKLYKNLFYKKRYEERKKNRNPQ
ncbi:PREDICTED: uncharacterized protein LOC108378357 isoform X2 [Rhagoletis zephyria]|uniref:uncharacterized protein LOC108378357 isoform X2 n=1 Tax=Rhagoletis zephyria TaxID=28612 RepID=UPI0008113CA6|nr:PREDICTED: uncharacterized protein LOC108378357 isoform X2 [Rhagoletis zephyria]